MGNIMDDWFGFNPPAKPKIPDPVKVAENQASTQASYNAQQAEQQNRYLLDALRTNISANRLDQSTPFMNVNYSITGTDPYGNPTYGVNTSYTPDQQALLDQLEQSQLGFGQFGSNLINAVNTSDIYQGVPDFTSMMNPLMQRQMAIMNPYYEQQFNKLDSDLRNQGLIPGTPGYDQAIRSLLQTQNESMGQFVNQSMPTVMAAYKQPLDIIKSIMGATGPMAMNNLGLQTPPAVNMGAPTVGGVTFSGINSDVLNMLNKQYEQEMAQYSGGINALTGIAGTILGAPSGTLVGNVVGNAGSGLANMLGLGSYASNPATPLLRSAPPRA